MNRKDKNVEVLNGLLAYIEKEQFSGWDPYDALNSKFLTIVSLGNKYIRAGFTQFMRRSSLNLRPILGIKKGHNPKGIGLFLEAYSKLYKVSGDVKYLKQIDILIDILDKTKSVGYTGSCWGYNFPWQSKVLFKPRWTPTVVNTAFIGHALLYCYEFTGNQKAYELAKTIPDFIINDLNRDNTADSFCLSYSPMDREFVHNANMLGASYLIRFGKLADDRNLIELAHKSLKYSIDAQNEDGSWHFAVLNTHKWVDSFHTGFKLESIRWFIELGEGEKYLDSYQRGVDFYKKHFFLADGTPKYYHDRVYPIDIHAPAEAIYFFSKFNDADATELTERVLTWVIKHMYNPDGGWFYFRKGKFAVNKISYMRWTQSWILRGLSEYIYNKEIAGNG